MTDHSAAGAVPPSGSKKRLVSLNLRMLLVLLLGCALAYGAFLGVGELGYYLVERLYMSTELQTQRQLALVDELTDYVQRYHIKSTDSKALSEWCREVRNVYLSVYKDGSEVLGTDGTYVAETSLETYTDNDLVNRAQDAASKAADNTSAQSIFQTENSESGTAASDSDAQVQQQDSALEETLQQEMQKTLPAVYAPAQSESSVSSQEGEAAPQSSETVLQQDEAAPQEKTSEESVPQETLSYEVCADEIEEDVWYPALYEIPFEDATGTVSVIDYSELDYYNLVYTARLLAVLVVLLGIILLYTSSITRRVQQLSRMVGRVAEGDLEARIQPRGGDELYSLATDVEAMRTSIVQRLLSEQQAWQANNQLITAISHDIRNPLTSLLGYADLLANGQVEDPKLQKKYLACCRDKAYQLKELTDELFGYFVVFGSPTLKTSLEELDLSILLEQLLEEAVFRLRSEEFCVEYSSVPECGSCLAKVDVQLLKRLFDNLFSNIGKYADPACPVCVTVCLKETAENTCKSMCVTLQNTVLVRRSRTESNRIGLRTCEKIARELGLQFSYSAKAEHGMPEKFTVVVQIPIRPNVLPIAEDPSDLL